MDAKQKILPTKIMEFKMTTVKIELQFNRSGVTKDDVYEYLNELMSDDNLDFYSISIHQDGKLKEIEWDHKEL